MSDQGSPKQQVIPEDPFAYDEPPKPAKPVAP